MAAAGGSAQAAELSKGKRKKEARRRNKAMPRWQKKARRDAAAAAASAALDGRKGRAPERHLKRAVAAKLCSLLDVPEEDPHLQRPLNTFDNWRSVAAELLDWCYSEFGLAVPQTELLSEMSAAELAERVAALAADRDGADPDSAAHSAAFAAQGALQGTDPEHPDRSAAFTDLGGGAAQQARGHAAGAVRAPRSRGEAPEKSATLVEPTAAAATPEVLPLGHSHGAAAGDALHCPAALAADSALDTLPMCRGGAESGEGHGQLRAFEPRAPAAYRAHPAPGAPPPQFPAVPDIGEYDLADIAAVHVAARPRAQGGVRTARDAQEEYGDSEPPADPTEVVTLARRSAPLRTAASPITLAAVGSSHDEAAAPLFPAAADGCGALLEGALDPEACGQEAAVRFRGEWGPQPAAEGGLHSQGPRPIAAALAILAELGGPTQRQGSRGDAAAAAAPQSGGGGAWAPPRPLFAGHECPLFPGIMCAPGTEQLVASANRLLNGEPVEEVLSQHDIDDALQLLVGLYGDAAEPPPQADGAAGAAPWHDQAACPVLVVGKGLMPLTVVGDIHGQLSDLLDGVLGPVLRGEAPSSRLLFLGDLVDRGAHGLDIMMLVVLLKLAFPDMVTLIRGNHEDPLLGLDFGFHSECQMKYPPVSPPAGFEGACGGTSVWRMIAESWPRLPVAAVVRHRESGERFFACHGGLSPVLLQGQDPVQFICSTKRVRYGMNRLRLCSADENGGEILSPRTQQCIDGLLWSDPAPDGVQYPQSFQDSDRGCGWLWTEAASKDFCAQHGFAFIARAHQVCAEGFTWVHEHRVLTVFSASNYCGTAGNRGAVLVITEDWWPRGALPRCRTHSCAPHPAARRFSALLPYFDATSDPSEDQQPAANALEDNSAHGPQGTAADDGPWVWDEAFVLRGLMSAAEESGEPGRRMQQGLPESAPEPVAPPSPCLATAISSPVVLWGMGDNLQSVFSPGALRRDSTWGDDAQRPHAAATAALSKCKRKKAEKAARKPRPRWQRVRVRQSAEAVRAAAGAVAARAALAALQCAAAAQSAEAESQEGEELLNLVMDAGRGALGVEEEAAAGAAWSRWPPQGAAAILPQGVAARALQGAAAGDAGVPVPDEAGLLRGLFAEDSTGSEHAAVGPSSPINWHAQGVSWGLAQGTHGAAAAAGRAEQAGACATAAGNPDERPATSPAARLDPSVLLGPASLGHASAVGGPGEGRGRGGGRGRGQRLPHAGFCYPAAKH